MHGPEHSGSDPGQSAHFSGGKKIVAHRFWWSGVASGASALAVCARQEQKLPAGAMKKGPPLLPCLAAGWIQYAGWGGFEGNRSINT
eukprot:4689156-Ditylum_brightwellii.AAC.1